MKKKIVRLVPLYYCVLCFYILVHTFVLKNVPDDSFYIGWIRYLLGINAIIPSGDIFWKSIHAIWYVSVVWLFYCLFALGWKRLSQIKLQTWYVVYSLTVVLAIIIDKIDPMASVNFFAFLHYFVLGIIAYHSQKGISITVLPILGGMFFLTGIDNWLAVNVSVASCIALSIALLHGKWDSYGNVSLEKVIQVLDDHTYAIFLCHPILVDLIIPFIRKYCEDGLILRIVFWLLLVVMVFVAHFVEDKAKKSLRKLFQ